MTSMVSLSDTPMNTISNRLYYVSVVAPSVLIGFFVILSIFNQNLKGLAYLVGICVLFTCMSTINTMITQSRNDNGAEKMDPACRSYGIFGGTSGGLSHGVLIYVYTFFYLLIPMIVNGIVNLYILFSLALITITDIIINNAYKCLSLPNVIVSVIFGCLIGVFWSLLIYSIKPELTYHTDYITSNKLACSMPSKQNFKCVVKKNGEIIG